MQWLYMPLNLYCKAPRRTGLQNYVSPGRLTARTQEGNTNICFLEQTQQLDIVTHNCLESAMNVSKENVLITSFVSLCVALQKQSHIK